MLPMPRRDSSIPLKDLRSMMPPLFGMPLGHHSILAHHRPLPADSHAEPTPADARNRPPGGAWGPGTCKTAITYPQPAGYERTTPPSQPQRGVDVTPNWLTHDERLCDRTTPERLCITMPLPM